MKAKISKRALCRVSYRRSWTNSIFSVEKKLSTTERSFGHALSQQLPRRLIEHLQLACRSKS